MRWDGTVAGAAESKIAGSCLQAAQVEEAIIIIVVDIVVWHGPSTVVVGGGSLRLDAL